MLGTNSHQSEFQARFYLLEDDGLMELKVWCYELEPMGITGRSCEEWVREHFDNLSQGDLYEICKLPLISGNYQCLVKGIIKGEMSGYECPEWDDWIELSEVQTKEIPKEYMEVVFPHEQSC